MTNILAPEWIKDVVFYQIFPDRFARSIGAPNWCWQLRPGALTDKITARLREMTTIYGRTP